MYTSLITFIYITEIRNRRPATHNAACNTATTYGNRRGGGGGTLVESNMGSIINAGRRVTEACHLSLASTIKPLHAARTTMPPASSLCAFCKKVVITEKTPDTARTTAVRHMPSHMSALCPNG